MSPDTFAVEPREVYAGPAWLERAGAWCNARRAGLLVAAAVLQVGLLAGMVAIHATPLLVGETILLHVEPVDPRDLFRGDYVTLAYAISRVPPQGIEGIPNALHEPNYYLRREPEERTVYVSLEREADGRHWHATKFSTQRPATGPFIRGVYRTYVYGPSRLFYGIESFYVPEGTGHGYEDAARRRNLSAEIALTSWGQAQLRALRFDASPAPKKQK